MFEAGFETAAAPLAMLFTAMRPRAALPESEPRPDHAARELAADLAGHARGVAETEARLQPLRDTLARAAQALDAAAVIDVVALQPLFVALVTRIAASVVDGELRLSAGTLDRLVATALDAVEIEPGAQLRLSPRDAALLVDAPLPVVVDPELADGEVRVDTISHVVAASLRDRLADIVAGLA